MVKIQKHLKYLCLQATQEGQASYAHVHEIIKGLQKRNWYVELFEPYYANRNTLPGALFRLFAFFIIQIKLGSKINKKDIIYIRSHFAAFPTTFIAKIKKIPVIQEVNGPYEDLFIAWGWTRNFAFIFKWLMRIQLKWADAIIVVTPQLKNWVLNEVGCNKLVFVIPNGANIELFNPNTISNYKISKPYVVFFGALAAWQGINILLKAVNLPEWPEDLKLVIMGDGVERAKVENAAKQNPKIIYLGRIPYKDVPGVIANSLAGLSPKNNKGNRSNTGLYPLKLFETLACGVPIIVTDFPGQADLIRKYNCGLVIPPEDSKALVKTINYLYNNPKIKKEMGKCGYEAIKKEHSWDKRAEETDKILRQLL